MAKQVTKKADEAKVLAKKKADEAKALAKKKAAKTHYLCEDTRQWIN